MMSDFIESIKSIGFIEKRSDFVDIICYEYKHYYICIGIVDARWSITEHNNWIDIENQRNFSLDDIRLLEKYFKSEIRDKKLNDVLI